MMNFTAGDGLLFAVMSGFALAALAPWLVGRLGRGAGWVFALLPLGLTIFFLRFAERAAASEAITTSLAWAPELGIRLSFRLDGLSLLFAAMISGIGALVMAYAGGYMAGHPRLGRFYLFLLMFMASMLGLVLADNLIALFVFWELTSISSYFLIGFNHERDSARASALQALLVTGMGGLALMAGLLLLGLIGQTLGLGEQSWELSTLLLHGDAIRSHPLYLPALLLVLLGAFTKSAQFPFHFWLPNAMEAPTPVSAYLHSSTMVKAGIYLMARVYPVLGGTVEWGAIVTAAGAATMVVGGYLALRETYLKRILAYSTVCALGVLTMLLGIGAEAAIKGMLVFMLAHSFYKGALFLVAGAIDHQTGERDIRRLGGLAGALPITAAAGIAAALSMAGVAPLFGFIGKESLLEAVLHSEQAMVALMAVTLLASAALVAAAGMAGVKPFIGPRLETPHPPREAPLSIWLGPAALATLGIASGVFPQVFVTPILAPAAATVLGEAVPFKLALWHGVTWELGFSVAALAAGVALYALRDRLRQATSRADLLHRRGPAAWYEAALAGMMALARWQTRVLQNGYLRFYLMMIIATALALAALALWPARLDLREIPLTAPGWWSGIEFYEAALAFIILAGALGATFAKSRLGAVTALGAVGYSIGLMFVIFGAPDLAITLFVIETLTVILFVLVFHHFQPISEAASRASRLRDATVALCVGALMTALVLIADRVQWSPSVSEYFVEHSLPDAHGRNIVNVILVDFRGLDTMGEITVLAIAALGVISLLKLRPASGSDAARRASHGGVDRHEILNSGRDASSKERSAGDARTKRRRVR